MPNQFLEILLELRLSDVEKYLSERNVKYSQQTRLWISYGKMSFTPADGARSIERYIESVVTTPVSDFVFNWGTSRWRYYSNSLV